MADLTVNQRQIFDNYKQTHPQLNDEEILSALVNLGQIQLSEDEKISILSDNQQSQQENYGLNFHKQEVELSSEQINNLKNALELRINAVNTDIENAEKSNGFLGKAWSWTKNNLLDWCTDSTNDIKKAQKADLQALESGKIEESFKNITGLDYTAENVNKFLNNEIKTKSEQALDDYKEGQDMAVDFAGDLCSGMLALGFYSATLAMGGPILLGLGVATVLGGAIKSGIKYSDAKSAGRNYNTFDKDMLTGGFSGVLAPITGGLGGAVGKTVATKLGIQAIKQGAGSVVEQSLKTSLTSSLKTALINPAGYEYVGGNIAQKSIAFGAEMITDGVLGGTIDGGFRAGVENDWDTTEMLNGAIDGGIGGALMSPIMGGGFKLVGKAGHKVGEKVQLPSFSLSSLKSMIEYNNFKKSIEPNRNKKRWDAVTKASKDINYKVEKDFGYRSFKDEVSRVKDEIESKYNRFINFSEKSQIIYRVNNRIKDWNNTHVGQLDLITDLTSEQAIFINRLLYPSQSDRVFHEVIECQKKINSPTQAYVMEKSILADSATDRWGQKTIYIEGILGSINTPAQAKIALDNYKSISLYEFRHGEIENVQKCYLYSKICNLKNCHDYFRSFDKIKTDEDVDLFCQLLPALEKIENFVTRGNLIDLAFDPEIKPLILRLASNPKLIKDPNLNNCLYALKADDTKLQAKSMLNFILSNEKLQNSQFLGKNPYLLFNCKTPEEAQCKMFALDYIISHKKLSDTPEKINNIMNVFVNTKNKKDLDAKLHVLDYILFNKKLSNNNDILNNLGNILCNVNNIKEAKFKIKTINMIMFDNKLSKILEFYPEEALMPNFANRDELKATYLVADVISELQSDTNFQMYKKMNNGFVQNILGFTCSNIGTFSPSKTTFKKAIEQTKDLISNKNLVDNMDVLAGVDTDNRKRLMHVIQNRRKYQIPENKIRDVIINFDNIDFDDYKNVVKIYGYETVKNFSSEDFQIAVLFNPLFKKSNINEIPIYDKKKILRNLVAMNANLFDSKSAILKDYPLIPKNSDEYCDFLPAMVRSLGIETNRISSEKVSKFNHSLISLSQNLEKLNGSDFAKLAIRQEYSKDSFIKDVLRIVAGMPRTERQKVYDYFGFELHHNNNTDTGFSISGYPVNLNNGKKLAKISDEGTKRVVEQLRPYVVKFSEKNNIKCNNPNIEKLLNNVLEVLPEMRTTIGKKQHKTQKFDIMQHSLKVMQKISQDPGFKKLNDSDKKLMIIASLLHDITKIEGGVDNTHAMNSSFDAFYLGKKLGLTKDESTKLYTLIKHHEWLEFVNTARDKEGKINIDQLTQRMQSVAYDLQQDNLFDMAMVFTHADLRAVKLDDSFHDAKVGAKGRKDVNNKARSYGDLADDYGKIIKTCIYELKKSQPLLPHTTLPKASRISQAITRINSDGSTNLRGVYVDQNDGLIIIKFNEMTDRSWSAIGMPKGSSSQTAQVNIKGGKNTATQTVDVGNINFIVHGLDYENQMINFDAFALKDSESLLSVSYTERPRDKYRFFRPQGLTLKVKTQNIHGGGATDAGSGCKKTIDDFKNRYIFGGERERDRLFFSELVKEATGMNDKQYIEFVQKNANKPMSQIEPAEMRDKIIAIYAEINSARRKRGDRSYNECYVSNAEASAPFVYSQTGSVGNPVDFLNKSDEATRTSFLRKYAHQNDEAFIVFGD